MNGLTFLELDYEINILKDSESLSLSVHLSFVISINHRIFVSRSYEKSVFYWK